MARAAILVAAALPPCAACGKEGPPLPPLRPEPGHIREVAASRFDDRIEIRLDIPAANFDGTTPPVIERIEIYMIQAAAAATAPGATELLNSKNLLTVVPVRREAEEPRKEPAAAAPEAAQGPRAGESHVFVDRVDAALVGPVDAPVRHYLIVGATGRSRRGRPSPILSVPLARQPDSPAEIARTYDEKTLKLSWQAAAGRTFRVYEASGPGGGATVKELTTGPIAVAEFELPVWFGTPRCFAVRAIETTGRISLVGPIGPGVCETPVDTFPPPAPAGLLAVQDERGIALRWEPVGVPDLAGYRILRGEGSGETLQQLLQAPIAEATYVDAAITPGVTYVYTVIAIDKAGNLSQQSNQQRVTARALAAGVPRSGMR